jgi:hypothetical protein
MKQVWVQFSDPHNIGEYTYNRCLKLDTFYCTFIEQLVTVNLSHFVAHSSIITISCIKSNITIYTFIHHQINKRQKIILLLLNLGRPFTQQSTKESKSDASRVTFEKERAPDSHKRDIHWRFVSVWMMVLQLLLISTITTITVITTWSRN